MEQKSELSLLEDDLRASLLSGFEGKIVASLHDYKNSVFLNLEQITDTQKNLSKYRLHITFTFTSDKSSKAIYPLIFLERDRTPIKIENRPETSDYSISLNSSSSAILISLGFGCFCAPFCYTTIKSNKDQSIPRKQYIYLNRVGHNGLEREILAVKWHPKLEFIFAFIDNRNKVLEVCDANESIFKSLSTIDIDNKAVKSSAKITDFAFIWSKKPCADFSKFTISLLSSAGEIYLASILIFPSISFTPNEIKSISNTVNKLIGEIKHDVAQKVADFWVSFNRNLTIDHSTGNRVLTSENSFMIRSQICKPVLYGPLHVDSKGEGKGEYRRIEHHHGDKSESHIFLLAADSGIVRVLFSLFPIFPIGEIVKELEFSNQLDLLQLRLINIIQTDFLKKEDSLLTRAKETVLIELSLEIGTLL